MQFLKFVRKRSFISELLYTILNIALAIAVLVTVRYTGSVWLAILIVLISKWRIFAVRPRFWWANLRSNMVDIIVSVSIVFIMYAVNGSPLTERAQLLTLVLLTLLYIGWLLFIKPRSKRRYICIQAGAAVLLGSIALFAASYNWPVSVVVIGMWLIGYTAARHVLSSYDDETYALFLSLAWGLVLAELAWVSYHWAIAYPLPFVPQLMIPQIAIVTTLLSFLAFKVYDSFYHHAKVRMSDVLLPLLFTLSILAVLLILFNRVGTAI